jgi:hypothetical protein
MKPQINADERGSGSEISRQGAKNAKEYENGLFDTAAMSQIATLPGDLGERFGSHSCIEFLGGLGVLAAIFELYRRLSAFIGGCFGLERRGPGSRSASRSKGTRLRLRFLNVQFSRGSQGWGWCFIRSFSEGDEDEPNGVACRKRRSRRELHGGRLRQQG